MNILIDSSVLIALHDSDDVHHQRSIKDLTHVREQDDEIWITQHVLDEVITILSKRGKNRQIKHFWELIEAGEVHIFIPQSVGQAWQIMRETYEVMIAQKHQRASYTDMHQTTLIKHKHLLDANILSYDHHLSS